MPLQQVATRRSGVLRAAIGMEHAARRVAIARRKASTARRASQVERTSAAARPAVGVLLAGLLSLSLVLFDCGWRVVWAVFAVGAAGAALANFPALADTVEPAGEASPRKWGGLATRPAIPLYLVAFSFGVTNGIHVTFAVDRVSEQGRLAGLPAQASGAGVFVACGALGLLGLLTARIKSAIGLP